jgi:hypothetical protein
VHADAAPDRSATESLDQVLRELGLDQAVNAGFLSVIDPGTQLAAACDGIRDEAARMRAAGHLRDDERRKWLADLVQRIDLLRKRPRNQVGGLRVTRARPILG